MKRINPLGFGIGFGASGGNIFIGAAGSASMNSALSGIEGPVKKRRRPHREPESNSNTSLSKATHISEPYIPPLSPEEIAGSKIREIAQSLSSKKPKTGIARDLSIDHKLLIKTRVKSENIVKQDDKYYLLPSDLISLFLDNVEKKSIPEAKVITAFNGDREIIAKLRELREQSREIESDLDYIQIKTEKPSSFFSKISKTTKVQISVGELIEKIQQLVTNLKHCDTRPYWLRKIEREEFSRIYNK